MQVPDVLLSLTDQGVIDHVLRPLKSGKEAQVYLVSADGEPRVAKVYKDAQHRSFKQRAQYMEGRRVRNTRDQRAMDRRTRHGKAQEEQAWKSAEVNVIQRLHAQGVRVPTPYNFIDGVLIMELVRGENGDPAPRLGEVALDRDTARSYFDRLLGDVVKMLCAGIVHGDLSEFNVLVDSAGPVIIDFPQSVDAAQNRNAKKLLVRDVDNLSAFLSRCVPGTRRQPYGQEIWAAYESNTLTPDLELTGKFKASTKRADMGSLLEEIEEAARLESERRQAMGDAAPRPRRREVIIAPSGGRQGSRRGGRQDGRQKSADRSAARERGAGRGQPRAEASEGSRSPARPPEGEGAPRRRRRRRGRGGSGAGHGAGADGSQGRPNSDGRTPSGGRGQGDGRQGGEGRRRGAGAEGPGQERSQERSKGRSSGRGRSGEGPRPGGSTQAPGPVDAAQAPKRRRRRRRRGGGGGGGGGAGDGGGGRGGRGGGGGGHRDGAGPARRKPSSSDDAE